ncbi:MAG: hypothetical protein JW874_14335 [Spirochaetales bacterium]|nr:hypothetical protein [Spirochaetales bacterium]
MKKLTLHNTSLFLICASAGYYLKTALLYFSIAEQSAFVLLTATASCLALGAGAILYLFIENRIKKDPERFLWYLSFSLAPALAVSFFLENIVPFQAGLFSIQKIQHLWLCLRFILHGIPLFITGLYLAISLKYYRNAFVFIFLGTTGTASGVVLSFILTFIISPAYMILPAIVISFLSSLAALFNPRKRYPGMVTGLKELLINAAVLLCILLPWFLLIGRVTEPGLDKNRLWADSCFLPPDPDKTAFTDQTPDLSMAYDIETGTNILVLGSQWQSNIDAISQSRNTRVSVIEPNILINSRLQRERLEFSESESPLWTRMSTIRTGSVRSGINLLKNKFDVIDLSCYDNTGHPLSAGQAITEDYTFTVETINACLKKLKPDGVLSITIWDFENSPRSVPRMLCTLAETLWQQDQQNISRRLFAYADPGKTVTFLVRNTPFTPQDYESLEKLCPEKGYQPLYPVYYVKGTPDFEELNLLFYEYYLKEFPHFDDPADKKYVLYSRMAELALENHGKADCREYLFTVEPASDNRPFFSSFIKPANLRQLAGKASRFPEEWDYILLTGALVLVISISVLLVLVPVLAESKLQPGITAGSSIPYYLVLGLAQAAVFKALISLFTFFMSFRLFSGPLLTMLFLALYGCGSLYAGKWHNQNEKKNLYISIIVVALLLFYAFLLLPLLKVILPAPLIVRILVTVILVSTLPFFSGILLPVSLDTLSRGKSDHLPWALAAFVLFFLTGTVINRLVLIHAGVNILLFLAAVLFLCAGFLYPKNAAANYDSQK